MERFLKERIEGAGAIPVTETKRITLCMISSISHALPQHSELLAWPLGPLGGSELEFAPPACLSCCMRGSYTGGTSRPESLFRLGRMTLIATASFTFLLIGRKSVSKREVFFMSNTWSELAR